MAAPMSPPREQVSTLLRLVTAGSVDDGKSTLVGRLLHDTQSILADQLAAVDRATRARGGAVGDAPDLALHTDGLRAEREQGITIDVAYRYFATPTRKFVLADCPGHVQYTRNTVTGASTAELAVVLVDARNGLVEQTRRHLAVAAFLRVPHVVLAVNKMDLVDFDRPTFRRIESEFAALSAVKCTANRRVLYQGQQITVLEGVIKEHGAVEQLFPGEIPEHLPTAEDWASERFRFYDFQPPSLERDRGRGIPHIHLDKALQFLIGDLFW